MAFLAAAAPFLALAGAGVSAVGSIESGMYAGQVADNNATIATQNAEYATEAGSEQAAIVGRKGAAEAGRLKAQEGASGVDVNSGSNVDVQEGERETNLLDQLTVQNNAALSAYGYKTQAVDAKAQGQQDRAAAVFNAAGTLLGSAKSLPLNFGGVSSPAIDPSLP